MDFSFLKGLQLERFPLSGGGVLYFSPETLGLFESDELPGRVEDVSKKVDSMGELRAMLAGEYSDEDLDGVLDALAALNERGLLRVPEGPWREEAPPLVRLVISNTSACNLACSYCYNRFEETRESFRSAARLSPAQLRRALEVLAEQSGRARNLEVLFIGGEPLLAFDLVREAASLRHTVSGLEKKKVRLFLITNGTLLDDETLDFCSGHEVHVKLSLDGDRRVHDGSRKFPDGRGSYDAVSARLPAYFSRYRHPAKAVTATVDSYRADLPAIVEHFLSLGFLQIELTERYGSADPVVSPRECAASCAGESEGPDLEGGVKSGEGGAGLEGDVRAVEENYRRVAEILYGRLRSRQYANIIPFHDPLLFLHARRRNRYPCRTGLDSAALFTDGLFYPCHHFMGDGQFAAGDLDSGPSWEKLRAIRRHVMARERCAGCWCRFLCGGECYHRSMVEGEGLYSGFERGCARRKALYRQAIILYHRLRTDDPECLDWYLSVSLYP